MTTQQQNNEMTARDLRAQAAELATLEAELLAQLDSLPFRIAEAKREAESRYNTQHAEVMAGRSDRLPTLDYSEAEAIAQTEDGIRARAKQAGLDKLQLYGMAYRMDAAEQQKVVDSLTEPLAELEREYARVGEELKKVRNARATAESERLVSWREARSYESAHARQAQSDTIIRRMG